MIIMQDFDSWDLGLIPSGAAISSGYRIKAITLSFQVNDNSSILFTRSKF